MSAFRAHVKIASRIVSYSSENSGHDRSHLINFSANLVGKNANNKHAHTGGKMQLFIWILVENKKETNTVLMSNIQLY